MDDGTERLMRAGDLLYVPRSQSETKLSSHPATTAGSLATSPTSQSTSSAARGTRHTAD
jgi:hypothetical protein